jgi:hypothetical protein
MAPNTTFPCTPRIQVTRGCLNESIIQKHVPLLERIANLRLLS